MSNHMTGNEFLASLKTLDVEERIYLLKSMELYFAETKSDEVDFEKMLEWMAVTDPSQIEAQPLSRQIRRQLAKMGPKQITAH